MTVQMDETFVAALREVLVRNVETASSPSRFRRPRRWLAGTGALLAVVVGGGGIAYATGVLSQPGGSVTTPQSTPVPVTAVGKQTVNLGTPPAGARDVTIDLTCLTAGTFSFPGGASETCDGPRYGQTASESVTLTSGQDSITITATRGARWRVTATYSTVTTTPWDINASGQTYGQINQHGTPDLVAVDATNGDTGYAYANQLNPPPPKTPSQAIAGNNAPPRTLTVYKSDGKTPIGKFVVGTPRDQHDHHPITTTPRPPP
jgi:hypothetical protein